MPPRDRRPGVVDLDGVDDGTTGSARFSIGEYDVRMGSNVVAWVRDDEVELAKEE